MRSLRRPGAWRAGPAARRCRSCSRRSSPRPTCRSACIPASPAAPSRRSRRTPTEELKATYLPKMVAGNGRGAMCLTEPHAAPISVCFAPVPTRTATAAYAHHRHQDLHLRRRARFRASNIVHLVLAQACPTRPPGIRGISLFLCRSSCPSAGRQRRHRATAHVCGGDRAQDGHPGPAHLRDELRRRHRLAGRRAAQGHARHVHHDERRAAGRRHPGPRHRRGRLPEGRRLCARSGCRGARSGAARRQARRSRSSCIRTCARCC